MNSNSWQKIKFLLNPYEQDFRVGGEFITCQIRRCPQKLKHYSLQLRGQSDKQGSITVHFCREIIRPALCPSGRELLVNARKLME